MKEIPRIDCRSTTGNARCPYLTEYKRSPEGKIYAYRNLYVCEFLVTTLEHLIDSSDPVNRPITEVKAPWDCAVRQELRKAGKHPKVLSIG